jgi:hypothetical protein
VKGGGALVVARGDNSLYAFRGNGTPEFWKFGPIAAFEMSPVIGNELKGEVQGQATVINSQFALNITPNPFTSHTSISYSLPNAGNVSLRLYDVTGQLVTTLASGYHPAGSYSYSLLTTHYSLACGVYLVRLETAGQQATRKLILD